MRRTVATLVMLCALSALAQDPRPYDIGWFADPEGTQRTLNVIGNVPWQIHAVLFDVPEPILGYEFSLQGNSLTTFTLSTEFFGPGPIDAEEFNYIVGTGSCVQPGPREVLVAVTLLSVVTPPACTFLRVAESVPTRSANGLPAIVTCDGAVRDLGLFDEDSYNGLAGGMVVNPIMDPPVLGGGTSLGCGVVADHKRTFTALKSRFD